MEFTTLILELEEPLATVTLNRPGSLNTLSIQCLKELEKAFSAIREYPGIRAVVLTGGPEFFSAGMDLKDPEVGVMLSGPLDQRLASAKAGPRACQAIEDAPQVIIAALEGFCIGGGVSLAISCDFRVMAESAYYRISEVELGLNYSWGSIPRLTRLVGPARTKEAVILCEKISAEKSLAWGLAEEVAPNGGALSAARSMAQKIAAMPPLPVAMTKESVNRVSGALDRTGAHMDVDQFLLTASSADHKEGLKAFLEKRKGRFKGR